MAVTVELPDDVLHRLQAEATRQGVPVESLISDTLKRDFPPNSGERPVLSFFGIGAARPDLAENYKQIRRDLAAGRVGDV